MGDLTSFPATCTSSTLTMSERTSRIRVDSGDEPWAPAGWIPKLPASMSRRIRASSPPKLSAMADATVELNCSMRSLPISARARAWSDWPRSSGTLEKSVFCRSPFTVSDSISFLGLE